MTTETKIGIGIVHCQSTPGSTDIGFTTVYKSDNGKWSSIIDDTGAVFRHVEIDYETILRMIHFSKDGEGWYMCSMKPIPGRDEEYRASWVYFPSSLDLSQKGIKTVIEVAESQIKQKEFDRKILQEVIQSYTQCKEFSPKYNVPSVQHGFAFRDISGDYNLFDLYGCMYQKEFTKYEWVLLMDRSKLTFKGGGVEDISGCKILESHVIKPTPNEFGFIPYYKGVIFNSPIRKWKEEYLVIEFKKDGYRSFEKKIKEQDDFSVSISDCKKLFKGEQFFVYDAKTQQLISSPTVNAPKGNKEGDYLIINEQDLDNAMFEVTADGYNNSTVFRDLRNISMEDKITFNLEPQRHEYVFVLPLDQSVVKDCDSAQITIQSKFVIKGSPLKGYRCEGTPREDGYLNRLTAIEDKTKQNSGRATIEKGPSIVGKRNNGQTGTKKRKWISLASVVAFVVVVIGVWLFFHKKVETQTGGGSTTKVDPVENADNNKGLEYLKGHTNQIRKDEMEAIDDIRGLYDMINTYRFKDLVDFIDNHKSKSEILGIDEWKRLYNKAKEIGSNKNGQYIQNEADQSITIEKYLNNIEKNTSKSKDIGANQESEIVTSPNNQNKNQKDGNSNGHKTHQNDGESGDKSNVTNSDKSKKQSAPQKRDQPESQSNTHQSNKQSDNR